MHKRIIALFLIYLLAQSASTAQDFAGFYTEGNTLFDANKKEFVIRGVNVPNAWHRERSFLALDEISRQKVNCVRIVWLTRLPVRSLEPIIQRCISNKMIPVLELHDATGDTTTTKLLKLARYYTQEEMVRLYRKYEKYLIINIANEWGNNETANAYWSDSYKQCISLLRKAEYRCTIMIDGSGWGQNFQPILEYGQELIDYDPHHNLLFSVHMYGSWNETEQIKKQLKQAYDSNLPVLVGEFGYNYNNGENNLGCKVNHNSILSVCEEFDLGYLAWSWSGNNKENKWLDLVEYNDWKTLTWWGKQVFESEHGIKNTSQKASIF